MILGLSEQDFWFLILMIAYAIGFMILILKWLKDKDKIKVRIKTIIGEKPTMVKPESDNTLLLRKGKKGQAEWRPHFSEGSRYQIPIMFGLRKIWCIDIMQDAEEAIIYHYDLKESERPQLTKADVHKYANAKILDKLSNPPKLELPSVFLLPIILSIVNIVILLLIANKLGVF